MDTKLDILGMSDEEFSKLNGPPAADAVSEEPAEAAVVETPAGIETAQDNTQDAVAEEPEQAQAQETSAAATPDNEVETSEAEPVVTSGSEAKPESVKPPPETEAKPKAPAKEPVQDTTDYEGFYRQVMAPFKANGKMIQLQSAAEAVQLMQMGANYTKKMQELQPHRKYLMMLENNDLLDENKLSYLIDLDKKNPEAIRKLVKDAGIDPVDIDTSAASNYKSGSHAVTDQEVSLTEAIDDLKSMSGGTETLQFVNGWDPASKKELWASPVILKLIHIQRENGVYGRIMAEMERQKVLGTIAPNTPFLQAYRQIGDRLQAQGAFNSIAQPANPATAPTTGRTPVAVRAAVSSSAKGSDSKVRAAAATRAAPRKVAAGINPFAMSDEDFLKLAGKV